MDVATLACTGVGRGDCVMSFRVRSQRAPARAVALGAAVVAAGTLAAIVGCTDSGSPAGPSTPGASIHEYPPVPFGSPPGASALARSAAAALGRGVNLGNMLEAPTEGAWGVTVTPDIIDQVAAAGFQSVRLPVRWSNHAEANAPFTIDPAFLARVDTVVDALLGRGLTVVLNMHHYRQLDGDALDYGEVAVPTGVVDVRFVRLWEQVATHFRAHGTGLLFELYNEPHGRLDSTAWNVLAARALGAVRRTNPTRVVVIGPTSWNWAGALSALKLPNDAHLVATIHNYAPFTFTHQGAEWVSPRLPTGVTCCDPAQVAEMTGPLKVARPWADAVGYPIFVGEFGAYSTAPTASRVAFNRHMRDSMEVLGMPWHYWEFAAGFGVYDPVARTFRAELLASLLGPPAP